MSVFLDPKKGFALETSSHKCMGCKKKIPLNQSALLPSIIDLTMGDTPP